MSDAANQLEVIAKALAVWEEVKVLHNLTDELIEAGKKILGEE